MKNEFANYWNNYFSISQYAKAKGIDNASAIKILDEAFIEYTHNSIESDKIFFTGAYNLEKELAK